MEGEAPAPHFHHRFFKDASLWECLLFPDLCNVMLTARVLKFYAEVPFLNPLRSHLVYPPKRRKSTSPGNLEFVGCRNFLFISVYIVFWLSWPLGPWENIWEHAVR